MIKNKSPLRFPGGKTRACKIIYNILNKNTGLSYFVPIESKTFFDALESTCQYYFRSKLNIAHSIRYRYRGEDYNKSRIVYFTKSINWASCFIFQFYLKDKTQMTL